MKREREKLGEARISRDLGDHRSGRSLQRYAPPRPRSGSQPPPVFPALLIECWTLDEAEFGMLANKSGATRLGFAVMVKFFEQEARFPRREDVPRAVVEFMAGQVTVESGLFGEYRWSGSTIEYHRGQIREFHGFREPTVGDEDTLIVWLAGEMCPVELSRDRLRDALLARCRQEKIEPPRPARIERLLGAAEAMFERVFTSVSVARLSAEVVGRLEELVAADDPDAVGGRRSFLQELREDPGSIHWTRC
ncbi:MAG: DUF4158 domain-containing protein [Pseudonocardiaceae bacterium]